MRTRSWAVAAAAATALVTTAAASPASAAGGVPWSVGHGTARAEGERSIGRSGGGVPEVRMNGTLTRTGDGCSSVWLAMQFDFVPAPPRKQAEVCGDGTVPVDIRFLLRSPTTTARLTVCQGTENTRDCAPWQSVTHWPIG
ncbi:hypothetical protein [Streptomyces sp. NPDC101132]|uniref:hypothetical protein n=1 Tax=Streptomyces sp. NPDC101132 TaxID=3366110 RepID=UPI00381C1D98